MELIAVYGRSVNRVGFRRGPAMRQHRRGGARSVGTSRSAPTAGVERVMLITDDELLRRADALLHGFIVDALARAAALLRLIADGKVDPAVAGAASDDLIRCLKRPGRLIRRHETRARIERDEPPCAGSLAEGSAR